MEKIGRERRSESAWREIVSRQAESGLSVQAFCEREGIKAASLTDGARGYSRRLREGARRGARRGSRDQRSPRESSSIWAH